MKLFSPALALATIVIAASSFARDTTLFVTNDGAAVSASNKAAALARKGDMQGALQYYTTAIKLDPTFYLAIYSRGQAYMSLHKWSEANADFNQTLRVCPDFFLAALRRAEVNGYTSHYDKALTELNHIISLRPMTPLLALAYNDRAWIRAACPNPGFRNGNEAVRDAKAACNLDTWDNWDYIDTLAAAYGEVGDFANAVKFEQKALKKARDKDDRASAEKHLAQYEQQKPVRAAQR